MPRWICRRSPKREVFGLPADTEMAVLSLAARLQIAPAAAAQESGYGTETVREFSDMEIPREPATLIGGERCARIHQSGDPAILDKTRPFVRI